MNTATMGMKDYYDAVIRNRWLALVLFVLSLSVAGILCVVLPKSYRSSTLILVEDQKIPEDYVKGVVAGSVEERLSMIQQQVMSRTLLSQIIEEFKLYQPAIRREGLESVIEDMRKHIKVQTVGTTSGRGRSVEAFSISFAHEKPQVAMNVASRLAAQFIQENLKVREQLVEGASQFLEQEVNLAKARLEAQEQAISDFKAKYMGELPGQTEANLRALDRFQQERNLASEAMHRLTDRLGLVDKAIKEYQSTGSTTEGLPASQGGGEPLVMRLKELEKVLASLTAEYKETYPDILHTRLEIEKIKAQLAEKYAENSQDSAGPSGPDPYLRGLRKQRDEIRLELAAWKNRELSLVNQMAQLEKRVERTPAREQELMILVRDYENLRQNYGSLLEKKLNARVAENLEKRQKGEQFRIVDPANFPEKPEKPDILRIMLMGLAAGCALAFGIPIGLEQLQPAFRKPEDIESVLGLPILASIPLFQRAFAPSRHVSARLLSGPSLSALPQLPGKVEPAANGNGSSNGHARWRRWGWANTSVAGTDLPNELNLIAKWRPWSAVTEQFRVGATRLTLLQQGRPSTVIIVTSSVKGEGKSAVAVNFAYVLARDLGKTTLLIDADLKRPAVHKYAGVQASPGLQEVLRKEADVESCLQTIEGVPLWILPAGTHADQTFDLSKIHDVQHVIDTMKPRFDYIVLDGPPILPLADMHVLSGMADIVTLVVRAGATKQAVVQKALNTVKLLNPPCIVLNGLQEEVVPYYMQEGYEYFSAKKEVSKV